MPVRVTTGTRLHFGFRNLSLKRSRLYGGIGLTLANPRVVLKVETNRGVYCNEPAARPYVSRAVDLLDVPGAAVTVVEAPSRHVGLGSGTQLALAAYTGIAQAYGRSSDVRAVAPALGRGGRSGIGVASFEHGGFLVDEGHPTMQFAGGRPQPGTWNVPALDERWTVPEAWRVVLVLPDCASGINGDAEATSIRAAVERAEPEVTDEIDRVVNRRLHPAMQTRDRETFGSALARIDQLNGSWYADEQGGIYRSPIGTIVETLAASPAVSGAGQSSWGPTVYGITDTDGATAARRAGKHALAAAGVDGDVLVVRPRNDGAAIDRVHGERVDVKWTSVERA